MFLFSSLRSSKVVLHWPHEQIPRGTKHIMKIECVFSCRETSPMALPLKTLRGTPWLAWANWQRTTTELTPTNQTSL